MNVFMPCKSIGKSVQSLDDARLRKQILECKVLLDGAIAYQKWTNRGMPEWAKGEIKP